MFGESERSPILVALLGEFDPRDLSKWDENKLNLFRNEIRDTLRKSGAPSRIAVNFDAGIKFEILSALGDDLAISILRVAGFNLGETIALAYCLIFSNNKVLSSGARRALKMKLPEVRTTQNVAEIPEEIRLAIFSLIQADEEFKTPEIGGPFFNNIKDAYTQTGNINILAMALKMGNPLPPSMDGIKLGDLSRQRISIAHLLEEYGPQVSLSHDTFRKAILTSGSRLDEEQTASVIILVIPKPFLNNFDEKRPEPWNLEVVSEVLHQECRGLNWALVAKALDNPKLNIRSEAEYQVLARLFVRVSGGPIPAAGLLSSLWNNKAAQFVILTLAANSPRNIVDFAPLIAADQVLSGDNVNIPVPPNLSWLCLPLYARMFELASSGLAMEVLDIMAKAAAMYPEYFVTSLALVQDQSGVRAELLGRLLPLFTGVQGSKPTSLIVMRKLYTTNTDLLLKLCLVALKRAAKLSEVINIENIIKSLGLQAIRKLETEGSVEELLSYWCVKTDKQELNLEEKLVTLLEQNPKNARFFANFAKQHADSLRSRSMQQNEGVLSVECFVLLIRASQQVPSVVPPEEIKALVAVYSQYQQSNSQLHHQQQQQQQQQQMLGGGGAGAGIMHNAGPHGGAPMMHRDGFENSELSRLPPGPETEEVENLANAYFQKIYTTDISIPDVITLLRQFKSSNEKKEQEIFRCMIHNLFDEYRFFHKYPEKELQITGRLFGALIQHQLVSSITLGIALRYVLEALKKDPELGEGNDKMFRFGQIALDQFRSRLPEWPQYCSHLIQIPHLSRHNHDLYQEAQRALSNPQSVGQPPAQMPGHSISQPSLASQFPPSYESQPSASSNLGNNFGFPGSSGVQGSSLPSLASMPPAGPPQQPANSVGGLSQQFMGMGISGFDSQVPALPKLPSNPAPVAPVGSFPPMPTIDASTAVVIPQPAAAKEENVPPRDDSRIAEIERMLSVNQKVPDSVAPPESVRDQIHFIVNNIAKNNVEVKSNELKDLLKPEFFGWFATYLVEKRISTQPNLHGLYLTMLDICEYPELVKLVLDCTYYNVTKFLSSSSITTSTTERSFIRYFGMFLGQLTLARSKPILQKRIDLKGLLTWGYENGRLIAICPFVAKVIEGAKDSKVFRPPNPWLMAILGLLKELNDIDDLKLNIKFEVQVLCKNINVKIEDIPKSNLLSRCQIPTAKNNLDFNFKQSPAAPPALPAPAAAPAAALPTSGSSQDLKEAASTGSGDVLSNLIAQVAAASVINPGLQYFISNPAQRRVVAIAVERGIKEILQSAVDRSVAIAAATTKQLVLKDFAMESNEIALRGAAHAMVSSLTGSLALATCKEPLRISIGNHLRTLLTPSISDQTLIEQLVQVCSNDNVELGSNLIEKVAIDKSIKEIDEALASSYQARKRMRETGQSFVDPNYNLSSSKLPADLQDMIRLNPSGLSATQLQLYEGFTRLKANATAAAAAGASAAANESGKAPGASGPTYTMTQALEAYQLIYSRLDISLKTLQSQLQGREVTLSMLGTDHDIIQLLREIVLITQRTQANVRNETAMTFSETIFNRLFEPSPNPDPLRLEVFVSLLEAVKDACGGSKAFNPDIIQWLGKYAMLVNNDDMSRKIYRHILILLLRAKLLRSQDVDVYMTMNIDGGRNLFWLEVALSFIKQCLLENLGTVFDYTNTLDTVTKMRPTNMMLKKQLQKWLTDIKALATAQEEQRIAGGAPAPAPSNPVVAPVAPVAAAPRDPGLKEQVTMLLERWLRVWNSINDQIFGQFVQLMHQVGVLKTEEAADKFFKTACEICIEACLKSAAPTATESAPALNFTVIDALSRLFLLLVRLADKETTDVNVRVNLLNRILNAVLRTLLDDHELRKNTKQPFDQRPYFRLFSNMSQDLGIPDPKQDPNPLVLPLAASYTQVYLAIQPNVVPSFAFAWLQLVSKRSFMPHLLRNQKGWPFMHRILSAALVFLQPFLKAGHLPDAVKKLYKGILRILLVLLHDFPEFLCDFHLSFCDMIPMNCVQLRNLVLSAFPRSMRLPDPFTPNLKLDVMAEASQSPRILIDYLAPISGIRTHLDNYLNHQQPADLPSKLPGILLSTNGTFNVPLITSLVVYVGSFAVAQMQSKVPLQGSPAMEIYKQLAEGLDAEGRYIFFNTMANQLRYPNSHTSFFSTVLLALFAEVDNEYIQEQITRVLLERLIVHRPHPWGLLVTFIELIKNPKYSFWRKGFTRSAPEIERVFESIARSCIGPSAATVIQQQLGQTAN